jgi:DNA replication and repair protein RecF
VEHSYLDLYKNFNKALKQRNNILKKREVDNLDYWDNLFIKYGDEIHNKRKDYFILLNKYFIDYKSKILEIIPDAYDDIKDSTLIFEQGWDKSLPLHESIRSLREKDLALKHTSAGPHRCDIRFRSNGNNLKDMSSMSTQVINGLLLVLSQAKVFHVEHGDKPIILIDDLFFGIDDKNLLLVINLLVDSEAQCFVTAPDLYKAKLEESINNTVTRIYEFKGKDLKVVNSG